MALQDDPKCKKEMPLALPRFFLARYRQGSQSIKRMRFSNLHFVNVVFQYTVGSAGS